MRCSILLSLMRTLTVSNILMFVCEIDHALHIHVQKVVDYQIDGTIFSIRYFVNIVDSFEHVFVQKGLQHVTHHNKVLMYGVK